MKNIEHENVNDIVKFCKNANDIVFRYNIPWFVPMAVVTKQRKYITRGVHSETNVLKAIISIASAVANILVQYQRQRH